MEEIRDCQLRLHCLPQHGGTGGSQGVSRVDNLGRKARREGNRYQRRYTSKWHLILTDYSECHYFVRGCSIVNSNLACMLRKPL